MRFVICVRTDVDWGKITADNFYDQPQEYRPSLESAKSYNIVEHWDKNFELSYGQFRKSLRNIAGDCLTKVKGFEIVTGIENIDPILNSDEEVILAPIDDDDWFAPNLNKMARWFYSPIPVLAWEHTLLHKGQFKTHKPTTRKKDLLLWSNNFMVRKSFLLSEFGLERTKILLAHHVWLDRAIKSKNRYFQAVKRISYKGNISIKHAGSLTNLRDYCKSETPNIKMREWARNFQKISKIPLPIKWCGDYVRRAVALHKLSPGPTLL